MTIFFALSDNFIQGMLVGAKLVGAIIAAAIILYTVLLLIRFAGGRINSILYKRYTKKYISENGNSEGIMTLEEYITSKSNTKIIDKSTDNAEKQKEVGAADDEQTKGKEDIN